VTRYIAKRVGQGLLVVLGAITVSFFIVNVAGNPVQALGAGGVFITPRQLRHLSVLYGYNRPLLDQFGHYLVGVLHGNFGTAFRRPVGALSEVMQALPATLELVAGTVLITIVLSIPIAVFAVLRRGSVVDRVIRVVLMILQGVPQFWLAIILVLCFSVELHWLPSFGESDPGSYVLPIVALALPLLSTVVRLLRSEMLDVMGMDFITVLRVKGLPERDIVVRHALRNAMPSLVTFMALQVGWLVGGTIIVEAVFSWPGIGTLIITATNNQDLTVIQALVVVVAVVFVLFNLLADLIVLILDPRLRAQSA
jgi:ABC-type dipeptide/oligopeptide/nickel transport system permease component